jgi:zinc transport system ATP-binding protein
MSKNINSSAASTVIELNNLFYSYDSKTWSLQDISANIKEREFVGIIGPNGGGKSTLTQLILGLLKPNQGDIKIYGKKPKQGRRHIGYFPQLKDLDLNFPITVEEVVRMGRMKDRVINIFTKKDHQIVDRVMKSLDIFELRKRKINQLSGGQRNRMYLARALATEPDILVLDEPMAGLDINLQRMFMNTLKKLNETMTIIIIDHNIKLLENYVSYFLCLNQCVAHGIDLHQSGHLPEELDTKTYHLGGHSHDHHH